MSEQARPRRILGTHDAAYFDALKELISSQSRATLMDWAIGYAEANYLPIFEARFPEDRRPRIAIETARRFTVYNEISAKNIRFISQNAHASARAVADDPIAQAAARACALASSTVYELGHTLGVAYYGAAAVAYDQVGLNADEETYESLAAAEVTKYLQALEAVAVADVEEPSEIEWHL
ncbi:MAG: hypothetical protein FWD45_04680 [Coriobacteriia bacterium]|nr:hypothetical protein [Coriobacteriia bacterium]